MEALAKGRTTFVIAHRLSTVKNAQKILVLTQNESKNRERTKNSLQKTESMQSYTEDNGEKKGYLWKLSLKKAELEDREMITRYFRMNRNRSCEYTFANIYLWSRHYKVKYAVIEDMLVFQYTETCSFTFPQGNLEHLKKVLDILERWSAEHNVPFRLTNVNPEQFEKLEAVYPGKYTIQYYRDSADYVYETEKTHHAFRKKIPRETEPHQ